MGAPAVGGHRPRCPLDAHLGAVRGREAITELLGRVVVCPRSPRPGWRPGWPGLRQMAAPIPRVPAGDEGHAPLELVAGARGGVVVLGDVQDRGRGRHGRLLRSASSNRRPAHPGKFPIAESNGVQSPFVRLPIYYGWSSSPSSSCPWAWASTRAPQFSLLFPPILASSAGDRGVTAGAFLVRLPGFGGAEPVASAASWTRRGPRVVIEMGVLLIARV